MKCGFLYCKCTEILTEDNSVKGSARKFYHQSCKNDMDELKRVGDLYLKYYNDKESWPIMMRSLNAWYCSHSSKYMLFCMSKAIREGRPLSNFQSIYYLLNDLDYQERFSNLNVKYFTYDNVTMLECEKEELIKFMENNESKFNYYVNKLNSYMIETGKSYNNHARTIKSWYVENESKRPVTFKETIL